MNAYYIQDCLEAQSWRVTTSRSPVKRKRPELADDMEKGLPQAPAI